MIPNWLSNLKKGKISVKTVEEATVTEQPRRAITPDEAREVLAKEDQDRQACAAEINAALAKYGFVMDIAKPQILLVRQPHGG